jgi:hypothetical protein
MNIYPTHTPGLPRTFGLPLFAVGLIACVLAVPTASAQNRVGNDGRALDANQQVGSGGYNPADGRLDYSRRNDIITGNVGGGRGFQDTIGYGAVGEFQDNLGSDNLFNYRAGSLSSSTSYLNATGIGGVGSQGNPSVYRSFTNRVALTQPPGLIAPSGGGFQLVPNGSLSTLRGGQVSAYRVGNLTPGLALQSFSSSPVLGLRGNPITSEAISRKLQEATDEYNDLDMPKNMIHTNIYGTDLFDPYGKPKQDKDEQLKLQVGQIPPTLIIGQQLQTLFDPSADPLEAYKNTRNAQVLDTVFNRLKNTDPKADEGSTYLKLLRAIHDDKGESSGDDAWDGTLDTPTSQQLTEAELAYDQIMKDMYGEDYGSRRNASSSTQDPDAQGDEAEGDVQDVVSQLNYNLPRIETLASNKQNRIARLTRDAEAALANGKYLTAESRYRQILLDVRDDPFPQVGLVHAQLGAGMFRSAGMNLRSVFVQHPELIAARYDAKLLPPEARLQWVQQELQSAISQGEGGKDAPLLLAYMGYQANSRQVIRYGLALAQAKSPRDPLLSVLREIWLDESDRE